jgi:hypothetical protein
MILLLQRTFFRHSRLPRRFGNSRSLSGIQVFQDDVKSMTLDSGYNHAGMTAKWYALQKSSL